MKVFTILILVIMANPVLPYNPNVSRSPIPTNGLYVVMNGMYQNQVQDVNVDIVEFVRKSNEVSREALNNPVGLGPIRVNQTVFVMENGSYETGTAERFDLPFNKIQDAIDAVPTGGLNWLIVVYPGYYIGDLVMPDNISMYFYGGTTIEGGIQLGNNTRLQLDCGSVITGIVTDGGNSVNSVICGCGTLSTIEVINTASSIVAEGYQLNGFNVVDGSLDLHFKKKVNGNAITVAGTGVVSINGLDFNGSVSLQNITLGGTAVVNIRNCSFFYAAALELIVINGATVNITNSTIVSDDLAIHLNTGFLFMDGCSRVESTGGTYAISCVSGVSSAIIRKSYITVANSSGANQTAIRVGTGCAFILDSSTIIGKGTGYSVENNVPTNIQSQFGNQSNKVVDPVNITETVSTINVDAAIQ